MPKSLSVDARSRPTPSSPAAGPVGGTNPSSPVPFFFAKKTGDEIVIRGQPACQLGHKLPSRTAAIADGVFAGWNWDGRVLEVENDRYGVHPLFYYSRGDEFAVAPSVVTLLREGAPADLDLDALAVFMELGFFIDDETPFRHIRAVPPSLRFAWDGNLDVREHRDLGARQQVSRPEALQIYAELFREAIRRRSPSGQVVLPLSGGRDSRHILLAIHEAGVRPAFCISATRYGRGNNDVDVARMLATTLGLEHVALQPGPRLEAELKKNLATSFCADEHAWLIPLAERLNGRGLTIYDGIGGDVLSASLFQKPAWLEHYRARRFAELARVLTGKSSDRIMALEGAEARRLREEARDRIVVELERYADATNPSTMFFFWNRTRREIALAPFGLLSGVETCYCPYLDHDVFDFLASLPPEITIDRSFHTETIALAYPAAEAVPYAVPSRSRRSGRASSGTASARVAAALGCAVCSRHIRLRSSRVGRQSARP
jgi:asparagine synthase (glutamine-hydrolysing)